MAGKLTVNPIQINDSATATNNFVLKADNAGGVKLSRGNDGVTTQDILSVASDGKVTLTNGETITVSKLQSGVAQNSTSGTSIDFTGIPSWAKRITVMFSGVSTNGTSVPLIQLGDSGGIENTGYLAHAVVIQDGGGTGGADYTTGFGLVHDSSSSSTVSGLYVLTNLSGNLWVISGNIRQANNRTGMLGGEKSTSATLDRIRITTVNGTDTFDAGSINILWE